MRIRKSLRIWKNNKLKKAQEEIVGFVAVVVLVAIVLLIVFALIMRRQGNEPMRDSREISEFLEASFRYTTDCEIYSEYQYSELGELFPKCRSRDRCLSSENPCEIIEEDLKEMIRASWPVGEDRPVKGYIVNASYVSGNRTENREIESFLHFSEGKCAENYRGAEQYISDEPGRIYVSLKVCS